MYLSAGLATDRRRPLFSPRIHDRLGVASLLTYQIPVPEDPGTTVGLALPSDALDAQALWVSGLLATQCASAVAAQRHQQHLQNLGRALISNRAIGVVNLNR